MASSTIAADAHAVLEELAGPGTQLRGDQLAAIEALVSEHQRVLLVQATGWGKSAVYWIATRLLRRGGAGPTLVVSPLLALMRNQVAAVVTLRGPPGNFFGWLPKKCNFPVDRSERPP